MTTFVKWCKGLQHRQIALPQAHCPTEFKYPLFDSWQGNEIFLFSNMSRPAVASNQSPIQWTLVLNWPGCEVTMPVLNLTMMDVLRPLSRLAFVAL